MGPVGKVSIRSSGGPVRGHLPVRKKLHAKERPWAVQRRSGRREAHQTGALASRSDLPSRRHRWHRISAAIAPRAGRLLVDTAVSPRERKGKQKKEVRSSKFEFSAKDRPCDGQKNRALDGSDYPASQSFDAIAVKVVLVTALGAEYIA